ncbi:MAG: hypothetical protein ABJJ53_01460 [Sulfitobacter sp.]
MAIISGTDAADIFQIGLEDAYDRVRDFELGNDTLDVSNWGVTNFDQMTFTANPNGKHVFVRFDGDGEDGLGHLEDRTLRLDGYAEDDIANFTQEQFTFAGEDKGMFQVGEFHRGTGDDSIDNYVYGNAGDYPRLTGHDTDYSGTEDYTFFTGNGIGDFNGDGIDDFLVEYNHRWVDESGGGFERMSEYSGHIVMGSDEYEFRSNGSGDNLEYYIDGDDFYYARTVEITGDASYWDLRGAGGLEDASGDGRVDVLNRAGSDIELYLGTKFHKSNAPDYTFLTPDTGLEYKVGAQLAGDENGDGINDFYITYAGYSEETNDHSDHATVLVVGGADNFAALDAADGETDGMIDLVAALDTDFVSTEVTELPPQILRGSSTRDTFDRDTFYDEGPYDEAHTVNDTGQHIIAGGGKDIVYDGDGDDIVEGGSGKDTFYAGGGADAYDGGSGKDTLSYNTSTEGLTIDANGGGNGTGIAAGDTITSIELLHGSGFDDTINAGEGMQVRGLDGDDTIYDADGKERMYGGEGADTFVLGEDGETDRVNDFEMGEDTLDLTAWGVTSFDQLSIFADGKGNRVFVEYGDEKLRLDGYNEDEVSLFTASDFVFASEESDDDEPVLPLIPVDDLVPMETEDDDEPELDDLFF